MTATSAGIDTLRKVGGYLEYPVYGSETIYKGTMLTTLGTNGYAYDGEDTAGHFFIGIAAHDVTANSTSGYAKVKVFTEGLFLLTVTGGSLDDVGKPVWLSDNQTISLSATTNKVLVGKVAQYVDSTHLYVEIHPYGAGLEKEVYGNATFAGLATSTTITTTGMTTLLNCQLTPVSTVTPLDGDHVIYYNPTNSGVYTTIYRTSGSSSGLVVAYRLLYL
ncbi:MAG: hypothetical protein WC455_22660 [Dehalococcoidia bacterium]|jgi:hypothetical protein